jgi:hypothetical protein
MTRATTYRRAARVDFDRGGDVTFVAFALDAEQRAVAALMAALG